MGSEIMGEQHEKRGKRGWQQATLCLLTPRAAVSSNDTTDDYLQVFAKVATTDTDKYTIANKRILRGLETV